MRTSKQILGKKAENLACTYLTKCGLKLIATNYTCKLGEIDLIMEEKDTLVFVEVRYRENFIYGDSVATVNRNKQDKIIKAAINYLKQHKIYDKVPCRFDIVAVSRRSEFDIRWFKDAFWVQW